MPSRSLKCSLVVLAAGAVALMGVGAPASSSPSDSFVRPAFGDGTLPAREAPPDGADAPAGEPRQVP